MAIYHFQVKIFSRSSSACAVAKAAYRSGDELHENNIDKTFNYKHRENVLDSFILIPKNCPEEYKDRETLWNAVDVQKSKSNSRLAREFEIAIPNEWSVEEAEQRLKEFVQKQFVDKGMCADVNIHQNKKGNNLHAHVMCTVDPVNEKGQFTVSTKTVYANAEEVTFLGRDAQEALKETRLKYQTVSESHGKTTISVSAEYVNNGQMQEAISELKDRAIEVEEISPSYNEKMPAYDKTQKGDTEKYRLKKYDKDGNPQMSKVKQKNGTVSYTQAYSQTKSARNPWDDKEQLLSWRKEWADYCNQYLEPDQQIDCRSLKAQGIDRTPTVHEGVGAAEIEKRGERSEVKELNRSIREYNSLWNKVKEYASTINEKLQTAIKEGKEYVNTIRRGRERNAESNENRPETDGYMPTRQSNPNQLFNRDDRYEPRAAGTDTGLDERCRGIIAKATGAIEEASVKNNDTDLDFQKAKDAIFERLKQAQAVLKADEQKQKQEKTQKTEHRNRDDGDR